MNTIKFLLGFLALGLASGVEAKAEGEIHFLRSDTVEILFGNNSKIIVVVDSKEDLEKIQQYDVNAMLKELNLKIEETGSKDILVIEDPTGKKYLKDTAIVYTDHSAHDEFGDEENDEEYVDEDDGNDEEDNHDDWWSRKYGDKDKTFRSKRTVHRSVVDFGVNNYLEHGKFPDEDNQPYTVKPFGSWYVALGSTFQTHITGPLAVEWGGNVSWYNFKYQDASQIISEGTNGVEWIPSSAADPVKSKLTVSYINASLVPVLDFGYNKRSTVKDDGSSSKYLDHDGNKFRIGFGGYAGYKIDSYSKFVYKDDGKNKDRNHDGYYLENFRYGLRFVMGYDDMDLFINYDLNDLFHEGRGPQLNAFSFGISF